MLAFFLAMEGEITALYAGQIKIQEAIIEARRLLMQGGHNTDQSQRILDLLASLQKDLDNITHRAKQINKELEEYKKSVGLA